MTTGGGGETYAAGDEVLISDNAYDPTRSFALHALLERCADALAN